MDGEVVSELIYDQGVYYSAANNYYPYLCTGMEPLTEWDDQQKLLGVDGRDIQYLGLQTESVPYVYYTPNYEYAQSSYNPYNPYIPGAVIGSDSQFIGPDQNFTSSPYIQPVSSASYIPVICQSGPDAILNGSHDQFLFSAGAPQCAPPPSMNVATSPLKVSLENLSLVNSQSSSHQVQVPGRLLEGAIANSGPRKPFSSYGQIVNGSAPQIAQRAELLPEGGIPSVHSSSKVNFPANNGLATLRSNVPEWVPTNRAGPRNLYSGFSNTGLGEQNRGPRTNKPRVELVSPISLRAYTTKAGPGNFDGSIIFYPDKYNLDEFPVDYPDAKFFVIKSYSEDDVHKSIKYNVWSSTSSGNKKLDAAYEEAQRISIGKPRKCPVFLFFSVNASGHFCGVAEMVGPVDFNKDMDFWLQDKWSGSFPVRWHIVKDVPNSSFRHIILVNNEHRPVTSSRDSQEIPHLPGISMLTIFKNSTLKTSILDDFMHYEERERTVQEERALLARKSYGTSVFNNRIDDGDLTGTGDQKPSSGTVVLPPPSIGTTDTGDQKPSSGTVLPPPSIGTTDTGDQKPSSGTVVLPPLLIGITDTGDQKPSSGTVVLPSPSTGTKGKESNLKAHQHLELDGKAVPTTAHTVADEVLKTKEGKKQDNAQLISVAGADVTPIASLETDRRQMNNIGIEGKHRKITKGSGKSGLNGVRIISRHASASATATADSQEKMGTKDAKPYSVASNSVIMSSATDTTCPPLASSQKTDVLTVGSMEINLTGVSPSCLGRSTFSYTPIEDKKS